MWVRRIDLNYAVPMSYGLRSGFGYDFFKDRVRCRPEIVEAMRLFAADGLRELERDIPRSGCVCGGRFSLADIFLYEFLAAAAAYGQPTGESLPNLARWRNEIALRLPSNQEA